jgi:threonine dehydratase
MSLAAKAMRPAIRVFGCEPERADDAYRSLTSGQLQPLEKSDTIADGLRAPLSARTFALLQRNVERILLVAEEEIVSAMRTVWERMKIVIEPSSAVAVAPLLRPEGAGVLALVPRLDGLPSKIGIILSGGNVDLAALPF